MRFVGLVGIWREGMIPQASIYEAYGSWKEGVIRWCEVGSEIVFVADRDISGDMEEQFFVHCLLHVVEVVVSVHLVQIERVGSCPNRMWVATID